MKVNVPYLHSETYCVFILSLFVGGVWLKTTTKVNNYE